MFPLYVQEAASAAVRRWFVRWPPIDLAPSGWTLVEFTSALGLRVRMGRLAPPSARTLVGAFHDLARRSLTVLPVSAADLERASDLMLRFDLGLRVGDALHVAIAQNAGATSFVTLDKRLAAAAVQLGLAVEQPA